MAKKGKPIPPAHHGKGRGPGSAAGQFDAARNTLERTTHGAYSILAKSAFEPLPPCISDDKRAEIALEREEMASLLDGLPQSQVPGSEPARASIVKLWAAMRACEVFLADKGPLDGRGEERPAFALWRRLEKRLGDWMEKWGCVPQSAAQIVATVPRKRWFDVVLEGNTEKASDG